jgi:uncharacterized integral membrane protein (TIGR00697 family)
MAISGNAISKLERQDHHFRFLDALIVVFVVILLISNLIAQKICAIGPFRISAAQVLFPITYIFGDIFTEVYGYAGSRRAIWLGFFASALMALMSLLVLALPAAPEWKHQQAFETVLGIVPRAVAASLIAYWAGEFTNSYVMAKMKVWTRGRRLWARTIGSTAAGQLVDSILVMVVLFGGRESWATIGNLILSGYAGKVLYEAAATPLTYAVVNALKRAEGVDVYDVATDFSPFASGRRGEEMVALGRGPGVTAGAGRASKGG